MTPKKFCTLATPDGVRHYVVFLDAVYWRPPCSAVPYTKPKGWKAAFRATATCVTCIAGAGSFIEHTLTYHEEKPSGRFYWVDNKGNYHRVKGL